MSIDLNATKLIINSKEMRALQKAKTLMKTDEGVQTIMKNVNIPLNFDVGTEKEVQ